MSGKCVVGKLAGGMWMSGNDMSRSWVSGMLMSCNICIGNLMSAK